MLQSAPRPVMRRQHPMGPFKRMPQVVSMSASRKFLETRLRLGLERDNFENGFEALRDGYNAFRCQVNSKPFSHNQPCEKT